MHLRQGRDQGAYRIILGTYDERQGTIRPCLRRLRQGQDQLNKHSRAGKSAFQVDHKRRGLCDPARVQQVIPKLADSRNVI